MKHIAIIKLWALGDIVMTTPILTAIKAKYPDCRITWIVNESWAEVLNAHPLIADVVAIDIGAWRRQLNRGQIGAWWKQTKALRQNLRAAEFDAVINLHPEKWWSHLLAIAPKRLGLFPGPVPSWASWVCTDILRRDQSVHDTEHCLSATRHLGIPNAGYALSIGKTDDEERYFQAFLAKHAPQHLGKVIAIAPFSTADNKCWESERVAKLADRLTEDFGALVVLTMGPKDGDKAREIARRASYPVVLAEGTTLREYIAILRHADLAVTMDSSALHLCAAVGTPFVTLWGPTPEARLQPLVAQGRGIRQPLPCAPCNKSTCSNPHFRACMDQISVADVEATVRETLALPTLK